MDSDMNRWKQPLLVVDLDGTVVYRSDVQDIKELYRVEGQHGKMAFIEADGERHMALVADGSYNAYMSISTITALQMLQRVRPIVCATGSPYTTIQARTHMLGFADKIIFETGARILDKVDGKFVPDEEWEAQFKNHREDLDSVAKMYEEDGFRVDRTGREYTLRIRHGARVPPYYMSGTSLSHTHNLGHLDIVPRYASKQRAIEYIQKKYECPSVTYIGDDVNDLGPLASAKQAVVMLHASSEILDLARRKGWAITAKPGIRGIDDTLEGLLKAV